MPSLFDGTCGNYDPNKIYEIMEGNYPGSPCSESKELWMLQRECEISTENQSCEKMLEKAVAILAEGCHMPWWFNQCPVASGIVGSRSNRKNAIDLVHWSESSRCARLIELKWGSNDPLYALREILRYGVAYIFCRVHRKELPLQGKYFRPLMDAHHVNLEVVAPLRFYDGYYERNRYARVSKSLQEFASLKTDGALSMSLRALAFPKEFEEVPFQNGQEVKEKCFTEELTIEGRMVCDAFERLTPVWPNSNESGE